MSERNYPSNFQLDIPLERYPLTRAFMIEAAVRIKGEDEAFWDEALKGYRIFGRCGCMECLSFYLTPPEGNGSFGRGYVCNDFGGTTVIFRDDENGRLLDFELPLVTDVPFLKEYNNFGKVDFLSMITSTRASEIVQEWFEHNKVNNTFIIVLD